MTRWLEAARKALPLNDKTDKTDKTYSITCSGDEMQPEIGVLSVKSVLSEGGIPVSEPDLLAEHQPYRLPVKLIPHDWSPRTKARQDDPETYAEALRLHGAMSYGMAMRVLGWGGSRASQVEHALRLAGRIVFNSQGRAVLSDNENHQNEAAK